MLCLAKNARCANSSTTQFYLRMSIHASMRRLRTWLASVESIFFRTILKTESRDWPQPALDWLVFNEGAWSNRDNMGHCRHAEESGKGTYAEYVVIEETEAALKQKS